MDSRDWSRPNRRYLPPELPIAWALPIAHLYQYPIPSTSATCPPAGTYRAFTLTDAQIQAGSAQPIPIAAADATTLQPNPGAQPSVFLFLGRGLCEVCQLNKMTKETQRRHNFI